MKQLLKFKFFLLFLFFLSACGADLGNKLESDELDIYYSDAQDEENARKLAFYLKENDFLKKKKMFLRLNRLEDHLQLQMIHSKGFKAQNVSFDERKQLIDFQKTLNDSIFPSDELHIVITDNQFQEVWDINN